MADRTHIEWTTTVHADGTVSPGASWNPIRARRKDGHPNKGPGGWACQRVSAGCQHCYAATINKRLGTGFDYDAKGVAASDIYLDEKVLAQPLHWKRPRKIFVCSMSDLFGEWVPDEMIDRVFAVMALSPQHTFQVLTKRPERMREYMTTIPWDGEAMDHDPDDVRERIFRAAYHDSIPVWPDNWEDGAIGDMHNNWPLPNCWLGTSVEDLRVREFPGGAAVSERIPLRRRQEELCVIFGKATQERAFTANELAQFARLTLGETKGALRGLVNLGTVRKRTNPSKPTSNLYFRGWRDA